MYKQTTSAICLLLTLGATQAADLSGRVTDAARAVFFTGARVTVVDTGASEITDATGRFHFSDLAPGEYTLKVEYLGSEAVTRTVRLSETGDPIELVIGAEVERMDNILVVGQAAGQAAALNQQKNAEHLVNVLSADAVGQLPDQNVTEALQRVPGISITRDQGEGRFIAVRGMDPNFNALSINGVSLPSAEANARQVALDVIPSDLIEEITVSKTARADRDGDAFGGSIDVKSLSAFDRGGRSLNVRVEGSHNDLMGETSPKISGTFTELFSVADGVDNLGVAASVSWFKRDFGSDNLETDGGWETFETPDGEVLLPLESEQRDYDITRERLGLALNIDYQPSAQTNLYLRTLFSDFEDDEIRLRNELKWEDGDAVAINGERVEFEGIEIQKELKARIETQKISSFVLGGEHWTGPWEIEYALGYSKAEEEEPDRIDAVFEEDFNAALSVTHGRIPRFFPSPEALQAGNYEFDEVEYTNNRTEDTEKSLSLDFKRELTLGDDPNAYIKFGVKFRNRDKFNDQNITIYDDFGGDFLLSDFAGPAVDHFSQPFGPVVDARRLREFFFSNINNFGFDAEDSLIESLGADYSVSEDVSAAYVMGRYHFGRSQLIGGLRLEQTDFSARGVRVTIDESLNDGEAVFSDLVVKRDYDNLLPSLNFIHEINDRTRLRAAVSRSLVRPNFGDSAPLELFEFEEDDGEIERKAEVGNPFLEAMTANNFDLSIEYYPGDIGVFSAGLFYKDIRDFIVRADVAGQGEFIDFEEVIQPINGEDARLWGVELNWVQRMHFLPEPFDGLLLSANYTHTDSSAELDFRAQDITLPRQSDNVANLAIGYEKSGWSVRAAWTYRDRYFEEISELDDPSLDLYVDDHLQFDVSAKYQINDRYQIYLEGINLNDEPLYAYYGQRERLAVYEKYGRTAQIGLRVFID